MQVKGGALTKPTSSMAWYDRRHLVPLVPCGRIVTQVRKSREPADGFYPWARYDRGNERPLVPRGRTVSTISKSRRRRLFLLLLSFLSLSLSRTQTLKPPGSLILRLFHSFFFANLHIGKFLTRSPLYFLKITRYFRHIICLVHTRYFEIISDSTR